MGKALFYLAAMIVLMAFAYYYDIYQENERKADIELKVYTALNQGYYKGQIDAIKGYYRVEKQDSCYRYIDSPWGKGGKIPSNYKMYCND